MAHYLITGGAGFIGSHTAEAAMENGNSVRILDNFSTGKRENIEHLLESESFEVVEGDIRSLSVCERAVEGIDYVLHLGALGSIPRSVGDPVTTNEVNVGGTLNMLEASNREKVKRFVFAGSSSSYGDNTAIPKVETQLGRPLSPYAVSKLAGEMYTQVYYKIFKLPVVCLRYFNVFGPRQDPDSAYAAVIPAFFKACLSGGTPVIYGDGEQTRDFTYVKNVARANLFSCISGENSLGQLYNIAAGAGTSVNSLLEEIKKLTKAACKAEYRPEREGDVKHTLAEIDSARDLLGFVPDIDIFEGLQLSAEWYKEVISN